MGPNLKQRDDDPSAQPEAPASQDLHSGTVRIPKGSRRLLPLLPAVPALKVEMLTAVEVFSRQHDAGGAGVAGDIYRNLLPLAAPSFGEQYAFQVDLAACTGCKACAVACHVLNGLDEGETFRTVGQLHSVSEAPVHQTVTSACHHCLEPACQTGCPVGAYEKDPLTGIVKHLDDQCFGCQYCTLMCPYDVPKYNEARGIVRKCDMCSDRLSHGEAPACVAACPNDAISIRTVPQALAAAAADAGVFLPGVASPQITKPTTVYLGAEALPSDLLPRGFYRSEPGHWHAPLMLMLTLTQLAVGTFALSLLQARLAPELTRDTFLTTALAAAVTLVGLLASVFHLGRPALAWRAVIGLRTSWLSREALAFGLFFKVLLLCTAVSACGRVGSLGRTLRALPGGVQLVAALPALQLLTAALGLGGVACSIMVYAVTRRAQWSAALTALKFAGTTLLLGAAALLTLTAFQSDGAVGLARSLRVLSGSVALLAALKLAFEGSLLRDARREQRSARNQVARLMLGALGPVTAVRFAAGTLGAALSVLLFSAMLPESAVAPVALVVLVVLGLGELLERGLFFSASPTLRMPGEA